MLLKRTSLLIFLIGKIKKRLIISEWTQVPCCLSTRSQVARYWQPFLVPYENARAE